MYSRTRALRIPIKMKQNKRCFNIRNHRYYEKINCPLKKNKVGLILQANIHFNIVNLHDFYTQILYGFWKAKHKIIVHIYTIYYICYVWAVIKSSFSFNLSQQSLHLLIQNTIHKSIDYYTSIIQRTWFTR